MKFHTFILLFVSLLAAGAAQAAPLPPKPDMVVRAPKMRFLMAGRPAAGYFILLNNSNAARSLTGASSSACRSMTLNRTFGGTMMTVKNIPVPAKGHVMFAPGGYHLMCMSPSKLMQPGGKVPVTLHFDRGESQTVDFMVHGAQK